MAQILKGTEVVKSVSNRLSEQVKSLREQGITPTLRILRVGDTADQISYEKAAIKRCESIGIDTGTIVLPYDTAQDDVLFQIKTLNDDVYIHGVLILRPLPAHIDDTAVRAALMPQKDVDGITDTSLAGIFAGTGTGYAPCTAKACMEILEHYNIDCSGKRAVVIGRSLVVGRPVAMMLMDKNATVTICHTKTTDIQTISKQADIVIAAVGRAEHLNAEYFSENQVVIDVGINWNESEMKLYGDVKFDEAEPIVSAITPVPGGVGTVTTAILANHVVDAAEIYAKRIN